MCLQNIEEKRTIIEEIDIDEIPIEKQPKEDYDDLDEYSFSKFASMYFQGAASDTHIRQRLRQPLLYHEDEGDVLVLFLNNINIKIMLLFFYLCSIVCSIRKYHMKQLMIFNETLRKYHLNTHEEMIPFWS